MCGRMEKQETLSLVREGPRCWNSPEGAGPAPGFLSQLPHVPSHQHPGQGPYGLDSPIPTTAAAVPSPLALVPMLCGPLMAKSLVLSALLVHHYDVCRLWKEVNPPFCRAGGSSP
ncbi:Natural cytotoxicity triggering receptor 2 [Manis javanica]|nr:Natural cytotoxicity triggering receptor 2 [Manis javanica]